jgi:phospholipid/cholesterol/gamma-HCH transport system substrate-binding protein
MKIATEIKVAIIGVLTILVLIWGINYLKGRNILKSSYTLHAFYAESEGLESSAPVLYRGVKIGYVDQLILRMDDKLPIEVRMHIDREYVLGEDAVAMLAAADLLGTRAIVIEAGSLERPLGHHDTITARVEEDLFGRIESRIVPLAAQVEQVLQSVDTLAISLGELAANSSLAALLDNLEATSASFRQLSAPGGSLNTSMENLEAFTGMLNEEKDGIRAALGNLQNLSASLADAGLDSLSREFRKTATGLNDVLGQVNSGEGDIGRLIYSDSLYARLNILLADLDLLIRDLRENPGDYVQISVFGNSKKDKAK